MNSLVSVVIPAYNAEPFIVDALKSVHRQTWRPIEVVVVDDGSTDRTAEIVAEFSESVLNDATGYCAVRCLKQSNKGPSTARNSGILAAGGEIIALLDADDLWLDHKLRCQMVLLERNPDMDFVFSNVLFLKGDKPNGVLFGEDGFKTPFRHDGNVVVDPVFSLLKNNFVNTSAVLARKKCFVEGFLFNETRKFAEDWELWLRFATRFRMGYVPEVCVHERQREGSLSSNSTEMMLSGIEVVEGFLRELFCQEDIRLVRDPAYRMLLFDTYKWAGYYLMKRGGSRKARELFAKALRCKRDPKTIGYYLLSLCS